MNYEVDDEFHVGAFPKEYGYGVYDQDGLDTSGLMDGTVIDMKPRILLMGLRRSGKSSIQKVVFHKMSPNETLFLESTSKIIKNDINNSSFVQFSIWDFPGQIDFIDPTFDSDMIFGSCGSLVYVIDAKDDYNEALAKFKNTVIKAYKVNPRIKFEVFIHKVDGISDDTKMESQRDIHQRASDDLADAGLTQIHLSFHLTSIYDHSIFEAFSKVVQKLIPQLPTLENLLNIFISNSGIEKAFLFDVVSKIYIATDCSPVDMQSYELCCDMIDVVVDLSSIYSSDETAFDHQSSSLIRLNNNTILYLREVNKFLALVCILREENFNRQGVIDYNFLCFRDAISEVFELRLKNQRLLPPLDESLELRTTTTNGGKNHRQGKAHLDGGSIDDEEEDEEEVDEDEDVDGGNNVIRNSRIRGNGNIRIEEDDEHPNLIGGMHSHNVITSSTARHLPNSKDKLRIV